MSNDLMSIEIEIDPSVRAATFVAAENLAVKFSSGGKVMDRKGQVK
jgi:hypothetical protein